MQPGLLAPLTWSLPENSKPGSAWNLRASAVGWCVTLLTLCNSSFFYQPILSSSLKYCPPIIVTLHQVPSEFFPVFSCWPLQLSSCVTPFGHNLCTISLLYQDANFWTEEMILFQEGVVHCMFQTLCIHVLSSSHCGAGLFWSVFINFFITVTKLSKRDDLEEEMFIWRSQF